jgi:hypothetical protein
MFKKLWKNQKAIEFDWLTVTLILILTLGSLGIAKYYGVFERPESGDINVNVGTEDWHSGWNATILSIIEAYPNLTWKQIWNITVETIIETYGYSEWNDAWNSTVEYLIFENLVWLGSWNSTVTEIIENEPNISWKSLWNATVEAIVDTYDIDVWRDSWNSTVLDIVVGYLSTLDTLAYPEQTASYIVFQDGSLTKMKNGTTGQIDASSTVDSDIINWAIGNLTVGRTWQEKVLLKGNFSITPTILVPAYSILELDGSVTLANNANCDMLRNLHWSVGGDDYITVRGGVWDGNEANQDAGTYNGFYFYGNEDRKIRIENLIVQNIEGGDGVYLRSCKEVWVSNCMFTEVDRYALNLDVVWDSMFSDLFLASSTRNLYMSYSGTNGFSNIYAGGLSSDPSVYLNTGCSGNMFNNLRIDHSANHCLYLRSGGNSGYETAWNSFSNLIISDLQGTNNTYDAIHIEDYCIHNTFDDVNVYKRTSTKVFAYIIHETGANSNYNVFYVTNAETYSTLSSLMGVNSKVWQGWA